MFWERGRAMTAILPAMFALSPAVRPIQTKRWLTSPIGLAVVLCLTCAAGCAPYKERTHAKYEVGAPPKIRLAQEGGLYQVQWLAVADGKRRAVPAAERILSRGDVIGF